MFNLCAPFAPKPQYSAVGWIGGHPGQLTVREGEQWKKQKESAYWNPTRSPSFLLTVVYGTVVYSKWAPQFYLYRRLLSYKELVSHSSCMSVIWNLARFCILNNIVKGGQISSDIHVNNPSFSWFTGDPTWTLRGGSSRQARELSSTMPIGSWLCKCQPQTRTIRGPNPQLQNTTFPRVLERIGGLTFVFKNKFQSCPFISLTDEVRGLTSFHLGCGLSSKKASLSSC